MYPVAFRHYIDTVILQHLPLSPKWSRLYYPRLQLLVLAVPRRRGFARE